MKNDIFFGHKKNDILINGKLHDESFKSAKPNYKSEQILVKNKFISTLINLTCMW